MLLNEFPTWKQNTLDYWQDKIYNTPNMFYSKTITGASTSGYSGTPVYANAASMYSVITSGISNIESAYNSYKANGSIQLKFKESLLNMYTYINLKYISYPENAPNIATIQVDASMFDLMSYPLPDYTTLFSYGHIVLDTYEPIGEFGWSNTQLLQNQMWYAGTVQSYALSSDTYINDEGWVLDNGTQAVVNWLNGSASRDIGDLDAMNSAIQGSYLDNMIYRVFAEDVKYINRDIHVKDYMLNDLGYRELLNKFGWSIRGFNVP